MGKKIVSSDTRQKVKAADALYHKKRLGLGEHGTHEGWIESEEAWAAKSAVSAETRQKMIAVAAYYLAEKRGFAGNEAYGDWLKAEAEVDAMLLNRAKP